MWDIRGKDNMRNNSEHGRFGCHSSKLNMGGAVCVCVTLKEGWALKKEALRSKGQVLRRSQKLDLVTDSLVSS